MDIKANVNLFNKPDGNLRGIASISINDDFIVKNIKVVEGEKGLFVAMPSQKIGNEYKDVCFAKSAELREQINNAVLEAYEQTMTQAKEQKNNAGEAKKGQKKGRTGAERSRTDIEQTETDEDLQEGQDEQTEAGPVMSM